IALSAGYRTGAAHIFNDIMEQIPPDVAAEINRMMPDDKMEPPQRRKKFEDMWEFMKTNMERVLPDDRVMKDIQTGHAAPPFVQHFPNDDFTEPLTIHVLGTECYAFAFMGSGAKTSHDNFATFLMWCLSILRTRPLVVIHEITELHPEGILEYFFKDTCTIAVFRVSPWTFGLPVRRPRKYTAMLRKDVFEWLGSPEEFELLYSKKVVMKSEDLFCAPDAQQQAEWSEIAKQKSKVPMDESSRYDSLKLLTPSQSRRANEQVSDAERQYGPGVVADINQELGFSCPGPFVPPLLHGSIMYHSGLQRTAMAAEHLVMQGIPAFPFLCDDRPDCNWPDLLKMNVISTSDIRKLAGLAMHAQCPGEVVGYVLSRAVQRSTLSLDYRRVNSSLSCDASEQSDHDIEVSEVTQGQADDIEVSEVAEGQGDDIEVSEVTGGQEVLLTISYPEDAFIASGGAEAGDDIDGSDSD
ncbi:unnamed protein product, partial [Prorocentrum cordatum]